MKPIFTDDEIRALESQVAAEELRIAGRFDIDPDDLAHQKSLPTQELQLVALDAIRQMVVIRWFVENPGRMEATEIEEACWELESRGNWSVEG